MKTELSINELRKGDVLLFSVLQGDIISSLIGLLSKFGCKPCRPLCR